MRFDLTDLRLFLNVHEAGTITGGAERSHMALASASERIRGMEDALGVPLLLRAQRGVQPTPAGHTLLHHARLVLQQMEQLRGDLGEYGAGLAGHVRVLCNSSALSEYLPQAIAGFLARHPRISVDVDERSSQEVADAVRAGLCDMGLVSDAVDLEGLATQVLRPDPLVLVVPQGHALAARRSVALADVAHLDFIGLAEGSALQALVVRHAQRQGQRLRYRVRLRQFEAVCQLVGLGVGVGILPRAAAARHARAQRVKAVRLTDAWADRQLVLCLRKLQDLPQHAQQLVHHLLPSAQNSETAPPSFTPAP
ncbi:LysR substrate-binding domain-containing protein [Acidovorax sp.]|uniref:LysR substrate-binding domain-containing protein n=1 Tax=Acidovorax sp. TaxID=1872122 RepID=UPI002ACEF0A1|nr:LysR substrate-binding domain-containing protein [Acidovorax sp.]MDZ7861554.1 LysR substrate-binding domain-containing protein [Acidovorax sp.]